MPNSHGEQPKADAAEVFNWVAPVASHAEGTRSDSGSAAGDSEQDGCFYHRCGNLQTRSQRHRKFKVGKGSNRGSKPPGEQGQGESYSQ